MKFLKYLLFLLLIVASAALLFFATKDGSFEVLESHRIEAPPEVIFNFLNDYKNWAHFGSWNEDETLKMSFPENTSGVGASYTWKSEKSGNGAMETLSTEPFEKIVQKMVFNGSLQDEGYQVIWQFTPQENGTEVTWSMAGTWGLAEKIIFYFNNMDMENRLSEMFSKSLKSLEKAIESELSKYTINVEGLTIQPGWFYVSNTVLTLQENKESSLANLYERLDYFLKSNAIKATGPHFSFTETSPENDPSILVTVGIPVEDYLLLPETADIYSGYMEETAAVKVTLTGKHSFLGEAVSKAEEYISSYNLLKKQRSTVFIYMVSSLNSEVPQEWITEIFIPVENNPALDNEL